MPVECLHNKICSTSPETVHKLGYVVEVGPVDQEVRNDLHDSHDKVDSPQDEECKEAKPHLHQRNGRQALGRLLSEPSSDIVQSNCAWFKHKAVGRSKRTGLRMTYTNYSNDKNMGTCLEKVIQSGTGRQKSISYCMPLTHLKWPSVLTHY